MILEMHCHTAEHSGCSQVAAAEVVQHNFNIGLHGTVLTDHHYLWTPEEIEELRGRLKVPDYYLILSGQEVMTRNWVMSLSTVQMLQSKRVLPWKPYEGIFPTQQLSGLIPIGMRISRSATSYIIPLSTVSKYSARITQWPKAAGGCATGMITSLPLSPEQIRTR